MWPLLRTRPRQTMHACTHALRSSGKNYDEKMAHIMLMDAWRESLNHKLQVLVQVVPACCLLLNQNHWENQMTFCFMSGFCFTLFPEKRTDCYIVFICKLHCLHQNSILSFHICTTTHSVSRRYILILKNTIRLDYMIKVALNKWDTISSTRQIISPFV